jgi:hypothetical protein
MFKPRDAQLFRMPAFDVEGPREEPSALELKMLEKILVMKSKTRRTRGTERMAQGARGLLRA